MPIMTELTAQAKRAKRAGFTLAVIAGTLIGLATGPLGSFGPFALPAAVAATGPQTLSQAFDNIGITTAANATPGNFDGIGDSFAAAGLAADALSPGRRLLHGGLAITWPDVAPGQPDNVVADGQTVAVPGPDTGTTLGVIGASAYGSTTGTFTVAYADGTTSTGTVTFSDWIDTGPASGTDILATTAGWNPGGTIPVRFAYAAFPLTSSQPAPSVTPPTICSTLGKRPASMHIF